MDSINFKNFKLIVGLGNPGKKYEQTRHNVGFFFLDLWAKKHSLPWQKAKDLKAEIANANLLGGVLKRETPQVSSKRGEREITFLKPQTFMNASGQAIKLFCQKNGLKDFSKLLVAHDELDLALGQYKLSFAKSSPLHKGVQSIENELGSDQFWRLRIGVDNRPLDNKTPGEEYVLEKFKPDELKILKLRGLKAFACLPASPSAEL